MKLLADFFPVLLFFIAYKLYDIYVATLVAIGAALVQVGWQWFVHRKVEKMHLVTLGLLVLFGGMTLALRDPLFIKWKPTVVNWLFAIIFLGSQFFGRKNLVERMMSQAIELPRQIWLHLNMGWTIFFIIMGALNIYVAYNYPEDTWVNFKLFGMLGLTLLFILAQGLYIGRHIEPENIPTSKGLGKD